MIVIIETQSDKIQVRSVCAEASGLYIEINMSSGVSDIQVVSTTISFSSNSKVFICTPFISIILAVNVQKGNRIFTIDKYCDILMKV